MTPETPKHRSSSEETSLVIKIIHFKISEKTVEEIFFKVCEFTEADVITNLFFQKFLDDYDYEANVILERKETSLWMEIRTCQEDTVRGWYIPSLPQSWGVTGGFGDVIFFGSEEIVFAGGYVARKGINSDCPLSLDEASQIIQMYETEDFLNYVDLGNPTIIR